MAELLAPSERGEERDVGQLLVVAVGLFGRVFSRPPPRMLTRHHNISIPHPVSYLPAPRLKERRNHEIPAVERADGNK